MQHEIVVSSIGTVYTGESNTEATRTWNEYVRLSREKFGRASGETITWLEDGNIRCESDGTFYTDHGGSMTDYQKQATDFLAASGLEFRAVLVGDDCPLFCEDALAERDMDKINWFPRKTHIHGKHYLCTISGKERGHVSFDFWNSYADEEYNALGSLRYRQGDQMLKFAKLKPRQTVTPYDLLAFIQKYDAGTLMDFCSEFGYDTDSKRAEQIYISVCKEYQKVRKFFTNAELEALQQIA